MVTTYFVDRPRILIDNGHLSFIVPGNKNISLKSSHVSFNGREVKLSPSESSDNDGSSIIGLSDVIDRLDALERRSSSLPTATENPTLPDTDFDNSPLSLSDIRRILNQMLGSGSSRLNPRAIRRAVRAVRTLQTQVARITQMLETNDCDSNPCHNGGTCTDTYGGFVCSCPPEFEGLTCESDVNECRKFVGTDLGCQNGATCQNTFGGYNCVCPPNYYGVHCTERHDDCFSSSNEALCGHGTCVNQPRVQPGQPKFTCICDQGWTRASDSPSCTVDVNECLPSGIAPSRPPCHPLVTCINLPGSFICGPCPPGFTGNGQTCLDVNECEVNNGGCSPLVQCVNTQGSRVCGSCPPGYVGDGATCSWVGGICQANNGGCHPSATCVDNPSISGSWRECRCPQGWIGNGVGPDGCLQSGSGSSSVIPCVGDQNPCVHGTCFMMANQVTSLSGTELSLGHSISCSCQPGWYGHLCDIPLSGGESNPCVGQPCLNGGTCIPDFTQTISPRGYTCSCPAEYGGSNCQEERDGCGGTYESPFGIIRYPLSTEIRTYSGGKTCAWLITVPEDKAINLTIISFDLEYSGGCSFDFLQIHDGEDAGAHKLGRWCGSGIGGGSEYERIPPYILSNHNSLYLWFRSDSSAHGEGFTLEWNATDPICGEKVGWSPLRNSSSDFGAINSPGYPGLYPSNRDCWWTVTVPPGRRILVNFATVALEVHPNCSFDFLRLYDGEKETDPVLKTICNTTTPPPVTSSSNTLLIHFHSDQSYRDHGFHLTWSSVPGIPGCGGLLTRDRGSLTSPNFPDVHVNNIECDWVIRVHPSERVRLSFSVFDLEQHSKCTWDFLEIRDGSDESSKLIGRYCGMVRPPNLVSTGNTLFLRFRADASFAGRGFKIDYETACGATYRSSGVEQEFTGIIKSPFYPEHYPSYRRCFYRIIAPVGHVVSIQFQDFAIEDNPTCSYDAVSLKDGGGENSTLVGRWCGTSLPQGGNPIISLFNEVLVTFETDGSEASRGFLANFSTVDIGCGGVFSERSGSFSSPPPISLASGQQQDGGYRHLASCMWLIRAPPGFVIKMFFPVFGLEYHPNCTFDYISIRDIGTGSRLGRFCGSRPPPPIQSLSNEVSVSFISDESRALEGFTLSYVSVNETTSCGGNLFIENSGSGSGTGVIRSPGFPSPYPPSKDCSWTVNVREGSQIHINVSYFDLENHTLCDYDFLEIRNGGDDTSPLVGKFCGMGHGTPAPLPRTFTSHTNHLFFHFRSDNSMGGLGFEIFYEAGSTGCGGLLTTPTGLIDSPNYPTPYGHQAECVWIIRVSKGSSIDLVVVDIDLENHAECGYDYLELFDGDRSTKATRSLGKFCSTQAMHRKFTSSSNLLTIIFHSDVSNAGRGFRLSYSTNCNRTIEGFRGVIESPNFPFPYPPRLNCSWEIVAPRGNNITFAFTHFNLESSTSQSQPTTLEDENCSVYGDVVSLFQRNMFNFEYEPLKKFCQPSRMLPAPFNSTSPMVKVLFSTDVIGAGNGFRLEWMATGCGGDFVGKTRGVIKSPGFPNGYPPNIQCVWHISADPGKTIELRFSSFDMEFSSDCAFDYLKVIAGNDLSDPVIATLCHKLPPNDPRILTSSSNLMTLVLNTDGSVGGRGFEATFRVKKGGCSANYVRVEKATILSPHYPANFDAPIDCNYYINSGQLSTISVTIDDLSLPTSVNCTTAAVDIYDGYSSDALLSRSCGKDKPAAPIRTSGANALVLMRSEVSAKGFQATFQVMCGGRKVLSGASSDTFTSPNYPHGSVTQRYCNWTFVANDPTDKVVISFDRIFVRQDGDYDGNSCGPGIEPLAGYHPPGRGIIIRDGEDGDAPIAGTICTSRSPKPFVSSGSALRVEMYPGVVFRASYSTSSSSCSTLTLSSDEGQFMSPGYPTGYPVSSSCTWLIRAPRGNRVQLSFLDLDIEVSDYCNNDYVEVREISRTGPLIGRWCGSTIPIMPSNVSESSTLWIKFRTDGEGSSRGFLAKYQLIHGVTLRGTSGAIDSPGYPWGFFTPSVENFKWTIVTPPGTFVSVTFTQMELDRWTSMVYDENGPTGQQVSECIQWVKIIDGLDEESGRELGTFCGLTPPPTFISSANSIMVEFAHSGSFSGKWSLNWEAVETPGTPMIPDDVFSQSGSGEQPSCLKRIALNASQTYQLDSPGYPFGYSPNYNCSWLVTTAPGTHIRFIVDDLNLEGSQPCYYDRVQIKEEIFDVDDRLVWNTNKTLCGRVSGETFDIMSRRVLITFTTDSSFNNTGFRMRLNVACGGVMSSPSGRITSDLVRLHDSCTWVIRVREERTIKFTFDDPFNIPSRSTCDDAYLLIRNGATDQSPFLSSGRICGSFKPSVPETSSNFAMVQFTFNEGHTLPSFSLRYEEVSEECGGQFELTQDERAVSIFSPQTVRQRSVLCDYVISGPVHSRLRIDFNGNGLESSGGVGWSIPPPCNSTREYLLINDGGSVASPSLAQLCFPIQDMNSIRTSGHMAFIRYVTSASSPLSPFQARISVDDCGGTYIIDFHERIIGPLPILPGSGPINYRSYRNNMDCRYVIKTLPQYTLTVNSINMLDIPNENLEDCSRGDFLEIREHGDSIGNGDDLLGRFCGRNRSDLLDNREIYSDTNAIFIRFKSDYVDVGLGFDIMISVNFRPCGGPIEGSSGVIAFPTDNSSPYPRARKCKWNFPQRRGKKFVLTFDHFALKSDIRDPSKCLDKLYFKRLIPQFPNQITYVNCSSRHLDPMTIVPGIDLWFETKGLLAGEGIRISWEEVDVTTLDPPSGCGGILDTIAGAIVASPGLNPSTNATLPLNQAIACQWYIDSESLLRAETQSDSDVVGDRPRSDLKTLGLIFDIFEVGTPAHTYSYRCIDGIFSLRWTRSSASYGYCGNLISSSNLNSFIAVNPPLENIYFDLTMNVTSMKRGIRGRLIVQDCGGVFTMPSRLNISSPGYPVAYPQNTLCRWVFRTGSSGQSVTVNFTFFSLEEDCSKDFVEAKLGSWYDGPTVWKGCGRQGNPGMVPGGGIIKSSNSIILIMKTDGSGSAPGFSLVADTEYNSCGGHFKYPFADIRPPHYPYRDYDNNLECVWIIEEDPLFRLNFTFLDHFDLEKDANCSKDYLLIEEWWGSNGGSWIKFPKLCGHELPTPVITRTNKARVTFRTNDKVTAAGFKLHYSNICGGLLTDSQGVITSPNYPEPYPPGLNCQYVINRPGSAILVTVEDLVLEDDARGKCQFDSVTIFLGTNITSKSVSKMGPLCGDKSAERQNGEGPVIQDLVSYDGVVILFKTDLNVNLKGFKIRYQTLSCGGNITLSPGTSGTITRPPFPPSIGRFNCTWTLIAPVNKAIDLKVTNYSLPNCYWSRERVDIRDGNNDTAPLLTLCGKSRDLDGQPQRGPPIYKSTENIVRIDYQAYPIFPNNDDGGGSNSELGEKSFRIVYRVTLGEKQGCGGLIFVGPRRSMGSSTTPASSSTSTITGTITSPDSDRDGKYDPNLDCTWVLLGRADDYIQLSFEYFDLEGSPNLNQTGKCIYDFLEIRDGSHTDSPLIDKMCGNSSTMSVTGSTISSSSNQLYLHFHSDSRLNGRGFKLTYMNKRINCGGYLFATNLTQVVSSPNFPSPYPPDTRCRWHFLLDSSLRYGLVKISLNFTTFDVNCERKDMVEFAFSRGTYTPYRMCGHELTPPRLIGPNDLWMTLHSGPATSSQSSSGFSLEYKIADCNQTYTRDHGLILSPNYDFRHSDEHFCLMRIQVDPRSSISLYFFHFSLQPRAARRGQSPCSDSESRMEVREGSDLTSPLLATLCGSSPPEPIFSTSNQLVIYVRAVDSEHLYNIIYSSSPVGPGCGGNITAFNGTFTSPWYPNKYTGSDPCVWKIQSLGHHKISIRFDVFSLSSTVGCEVNYVELYDGPEERSDRLVSRYCGNDSPAPYTSMGSDLLVKLVTNSDNEGSGFKAHIDMNLIDVDPGQKVITNELKMVSHFGGVIYADEFIYDQPPQLRDRTFIPRPGR